MPTCPRCNGRGKFVPFGDEYSRRCTNCFGTGRVSYIYETCKFCGGTGREKGIASGLFNTQGARCYYCSGSGEIIKRD